MAKKQNSEGKSSKKSGGGAGQWRWLWITMIIIALDLISKGMVNYYLTRFSSHTVTSFLNIVLVYNTGSAFGFLANQSGWQLWLFIAIAVLVAIGILTWLWKSKNKHPLTALALCFILGGTLGNLYDRVINGYVIDFIDFHIGDWHWPAFNVADTAICLGVFFIILSAFRQK